MSNDAVSQIKDPFLRSSFDGLKMAAKLAREEAIKTNTDIIVWENNRVVRISATELRKKVRKSPRMACVSSQYTITRDNLIVCPVFGTKGICRT